MDNAYTKNMAEIQNVHWWYEGRRNILATLIKSLNLPKDAKILEAGCGPGANLQMLETFGKVDALEPEPFSVQHAQTISSANIREGGLPTPLPFDGPYDLVGAFDVIEHIEDDLASVTALHNITKSGGYALFTVPAYQWMWGHHDEINYHKRRYTRTRLKSLLTNAGYDVRFISYYNFWLFPIAASFRILHKITGKKESAEMAVPAPTTNKILRTIFASEKHILNAKLPIPFGLSVIALCQKN